MKKCTLANLPTPIKKLHKISEELGVHLYVKRDDYTGLGISGNKIRKLEYALSEAISMGANHIITCGGIQSNHARATAIAAKKLRMDSTLLLRGEEKDSHEGNAFFSRLIGTNFQFITSEEYISHREQLMEEIAEDLKKKGKIPYIIPEGASNAIGSMGYRAAYEEICIQERNFELYFNRIALAVGSGGTFAGLTYANLEHDSKLRITGFNICDSADSLRQRARNIISEMNIYTKKSISIDEKKLNIIDGYSGLGYAISQEKELEFILQLARKEGIILDPVYTGKAMYGLVEEIKKGSIKRGENILFIHTGGTFSWTKEKIEQIEHIM